MEHLDKNSLLSRKNRLRLILESTTEGWWEWNVKTGETYHSPHWYEMLGLDPNTHPSSFELWQSHIHEEDRERVVSEQGQRLQSDDLWRIDFRMRTKSGEYIWIRSKGRVVERGKKGNAILVVGIHIDISEEKKREELQKEKQLREELMAGIIRVSHSSFKIYDFMAKKFIFNAGGIYKTLGYGKEEFLKLAREFKKNFIHPEDEIAFNAHMEYLKCTQSNEPRELIFRLKAKSGRYHWITSQDAVFRRGSNGSPTQIIGSIIDISIRKELEGKMEEHIKYLENLSYRNSHDLRGPVATLMGLIYLMEQNSESLDSSSMLEYFKRTTVRLDDIIRKMGKDIDGQVDG